MPPLPPKNAQPETGPLKLPRRGRPTIPLPDAGTEMAQLYLAGSPVNAVALRFECAPHVVRKTLVSLGVKIRPRGNVRGTTHKGVKLSLEQRGQLRAELREGQAPTLAALAAKYGVTRELVRQMAAAIGVVRYTRQIRAEAARERRHLRRAAWHATRVARYAAWQARCQRIAVLWKGGASCDEIARAEGLRDGRKAAYLIARYRARLPEDFPCRLAKRRSPREMRAAAKVRAARVAAWRARQEARRILLARLWRRPAPIAEIAHAVGLNVASTYTLLYRYRQRFPADFLPRRQRAGRARALG